MAEQTSLAAIEVPHLRETFGHDRRAINLHSIRVYAVPREGQEYVLDRTLDGCPPFFTLYVREPGRRVARGIPVGGADYWGDGWRWPRAEAAALEAIAADWETMASG